MPTRREGCAIWQGEGAAGGALFIVEAERIQSLNLILPGVSAAAEERLIARAVTLLHPIEPYQRCLSLVRHAMRPVIASFTPADGALTRDGERLLFTCSAALFHAPAPASASVKGSGGI